MNPAHLQTYYGFDVVLAQFAEVDDLVNTVDEFRPYTCTQLLFGQVRGHDNQGVLEIYHAPFVIRQTTVVQHLQQDVEHIRMGFLNLVEQHNGIGFPTYRFGQLTAFVVTYVSRRSTDESRRAELLLILAHIDSRHHVLVVEQVVRKRFCQFGLSDTCRTEEDKTADRSFGVLQTCTAPTNRIADSLDRLILTDDPLVQLFFEMQQLVALRLHHLRYRNIRPAGYYFGDIVFIDFLLNQCLVTDSVQGLLRILDIRLGCRDLAVSYLRNLAVVTFALGYFRLPFQALNTCFLVLDRCHVAFLLVPTRIELFALSF